VSFLSAPPFALGKFFLKLVQPVARCFDDPASCPVYPASILPLDRGTLLKDEPRKCLDFALFHSIPPPPIFFLLSRGGGAFVFKSYIFGTPPLLLTPASTFDPPGPPSP